MLNLGSASRNFRATTTNYSASYTVRRFVYFEISLDFEYFITHM